MTTKLTITIKHQTENCIQHDSWDVEANKLWVIGNIDELGNNDLQLAKSFTCIDEIDEEEEEAMLAGMVRPESTYQIEINIPSYKYEAIQYRLFLGKKSGKLWAIDSIENKSRNYQVEPGTRSIKINLGTFGNLRGGVAVVKNGVLWNERLVQFSFSHSNGALFTQLKDRKLFQETCVKIEKSAMCTSVKHHQISPTPKPHFINKTGQENDDFLSTISVRFFSKFAGFMKVYCKLFSHPSGEFVGDFVLDADKINDIVPEGKISVPVMNDGKVLGKINVDYVSIFPEALTKQEMPIEDYSYNYWLSQPEEKILLGAHRGCGDSFFGSKPSQHRENTFNSFAHACAAIEDEKADFIHADLIVTGDKHVICYSNIGLAMYGKKTMVHSQNFHKIQEAAKEGKIKNFEQLDGEISRSKLRMCGLSDVEKGWDLVEVKDLLQNLPEDYGTGTPVNFEIKYAAVMMDNKTEADVAPNYENLNNYCDVIINSIFRANQQKNHPILLSSYSAPVCLALRNKQSAYPVMLLTKGDKGESDARFKDVAVKTNKLALKYAAAECFYGIGTDVSELLADDDFSGACENAGVKCFGLGKQMQDTPVLEKAKQLKINGLIYDNIEE